MNTMQFAHGILVNAEDHSQQITKPHTDFAPPVEDHVNPHAAEKAEEKAEEKPAKEVKKAETKTEAKQ